MMPPVSVLLLNQGVRLDVDVADLHGPLMFNLNLFWRILTADAI